MKQKLSLFILALCTAMGAWAEPDVAGKTFTLQCKRGYVYYNGTQLAGTNTAADASEFAIISNAGQTYLYDVTNNAFVCHTTAATAGTTGNPALESNSDLSKIAKGFSFGDTGIDAYPYYLEESTFGNWLNMDGTPKVYLNTWKDFESGNGGNTYKVNIVDDNFDQTEVINAFWNRWSINSSDLTTNLWTAMGDAAPDDVKALGGTPYSRSQSITISSAGEALEVLFKYISGSHRLDILGVDLLDGDDHVVASDYHSGYTGTGTSNNTYLLTGLSAGSYKLRYIINGNGLSSSAGQISLLKLAGSYANISQWYVIRMHSNYQSNYMYYDSGKETGISFTGVSTSNLSAVNNNNYLWGFVYSGGGIKLYNKSAGDSKALDYANPSTLSAAGTSVSLQLQTGTLGKYGATADGTFAIYDESATKYLNFQSGDLKRWDNSDTGSTFMIDAVNAPTSLSYIVKDVNGASYSGSYSGIAGVTNPAFSGCYGYSLSDQSWHGTTYKANITFPFPVSSNSVTNYTYIGTYSSAFYWYVKSSSATDINVQDGAVPTNQSGENEKFQWAIIPSFSAGAFTFTIKNASTGTYLTSTATDPGTAVNNSHPQGKVTLSTEGTPLTYTSYPSWYIPSTERYVSINTISKQTEQYVGIYTGNHYGTQMTFHTPANFTTLITGLTAAKTATAGITIGSDYGEYTTTDAYATALTNATSVINGESYATAADISEWGNTILTNPTLNLPVAPCFLRVKTRHNTYLSNTASTYSGYTSYLAHIAEANNSTLFYFDGTYLIDYAEGLKMNGCNVGSVGGAGKSFTFAESTHEPYAGKYSLKITEDNKYVYSWGNPYNFSWGEASEAPNTVMTLEKVTSLPITMHEVGGASYGTINMPVAVTLPSGLYAYSATAAENGVLTLTKVVEGGVLAANTPVVLYSAAPVTELAISDATGAEATGNKFDGTVAAITAPTTGTNYVLSNGDAGVGFYKYTGASVPGFKAYYNEPTSNVKGFVFSFDDVETAIRAIETENNGLEIHDIAGRRVQKAEKGLYIINGKKVMFK